MTTRNDETAIIPRVPSPGEDLSDELAAAAPRRWWNRGTVVLGVAALLMGGFVGGVQAQKQWGTSTSASAGALPGAGGRGAFPGGLGASGAPGGGFGPRSTTTAAGSGTTGKVKLVNGKTIYVETEDGTVVTVRTDGDTAVSTTAEGRLSDVKAGQSITVQGRAGTDGTVTATTVTTGR